MMRGDGTQVFKKVPNPRAVAAFDRVAARVRNSTGAAAVYEERVRGVLGEPQLAKAYFRKPDHVVSTFGRPQNEQPAARMVLQGRDRR